MGQESEALRNWISLERVIEDSQDTEKAADAQSRNQTPSNPVQVFGVAFPHLRDTDSDGQDDRIEDIRLKARERAPKAKIVNVVQVAEEVKESISEAGCGNRRGE